MDLRQRPVVIVGAGPVGLTAAVVLARNGVRVTVLEAGSGLSTASRASTFHPSTLDLLDEIGVAGPLRELGRQVDVIQWRDLDQRTLCELDYALLAGKTRHPFRLHVEQTSLTPLLLKELTAYPDAEVLFSTEVVDVQNLGSRARVWFHDRTGKRGHIDADYVLAADGSGSRVRAALGLPAQIRDYPSYALRVVTDTPLDSLLPGLAPLTYIRDSRQSLSILGMPDHWRLIFRIPAATPRDRSTSAEAVRGLIERSLPGIHRQVHVTDAHTYRLSSFVLPGYREGRVLFAGDSAHLTSTAGGMNMNCGLHDAVAWGRALAETPRGAGGEQALDAVAAERLAAVRDAVIPRSEARTAGIDDGAALTRALSEMRRIAADPARATGYLFTASLLDCAPRPQTVS
jgi:2-polyprenyl-6-methoxyphenol hydroxylase-like FAD-dependent oxidoreductase